LPDGRYALPGSSLKGMIRSVLEIASFSRMNLVDDVRMGVRDLTSGARPFYGNFMTQQVAHKTYKPRSKAGWLSFDRKHNRWCIKPCEYARVEHSALKAYHVSDWVKAHQRSTAKEKYDAWKKSFTVRFTPGEEQPHSHSRGNQLVYRKASELGVGNTLGELVFTGQPSPKKHMEFVFFGLAGTPIAVSDRVFRGFLDIHNQVQEKGKPTPWDYWRAISRIPVFYLETPDRPGAIASLGLAQMYKLAYRNSVHDAIRKSSPMHLDGNGNDLANLLFGRVGESPENCLKGRVSFGHATAKNQVTAQKQAATILNGPKPTYYPNYITQPKAKGGHLPKNSSYGTLMDEQCRIRGWKRYPARPAEQAQVQALTSQQTETKKVQVILHPLPKEAIFTSRVTFHNLKPVELGAVCWALTWAGNSELRHSLGMGKPFGFGQISIQVAHEDIRSNAPQTKTSTWQECRDLFIAYMDREHKKARGYQKSWQESLEITSLLGMADPNNKPAKGQLRHMRLSTEADNEFKDVKDALLVLADYPSSAHPPTWAEQEADRQAEDKRLAEQEAERVRLEAEARKKANEQAAYDNLPGEQKLIVDIEKDFKDFCDQSEVEQREGRGAFVGRLNTLEAEAGGWDEHAICMEAAALLTRIYEEIGWTDPGLKKAKRIKQEAKRKQRIAKLCAGSMAGKT
jgi:CRISPR-associated protein (TIGR03986 family)